MKNIKKRTYICLLALGLIALIVSCSRSQGTSSVSAPSPAPSAQSSGTEYSDGLYFAASDSFASNGWKDVVFLTVKDGKIASVDWNGVHESGGADKKAYDQAGKYRMVAYGGAKAEWYEQAHLVEQYIVETQSVSVPDTVAGASISIEPVFSLITAALASGPLGDTGTIEYPDGTYFAIQDSYPASGWKEFVSLNVLHGRIVNVVWNALDRESKDKKAYDRAGNYKMVAYGGASAEWYEQAQLIEEFLIKEQDVGAFALRSDGKSDVVAGASISVDSFIALASQALADGPQASGPYADGRYAALSEDFSSSGWKGAVSLYVHNGNIVNVYWSGINAAGDEKQTYAADGKYKMVEFGGALAEWDKQAQAVEKFLVETQDLTAFGVTADGHTDAVAGATIAIDEFIELVDTALAAGPRS